MHTVVVMIQESLNFPLIISDFHKDIVAFVSFKSMKKIYQDKGFVVVFEADITYKYSTVKETGDYAIVILY